MTATATTVPVPLIGTVCGLPVALSVMLINALTGPVVVGLKVTPIWQLLPGATEAAHSGGNDGASGTRLNGAPTLTALRSKLAKPVLVTTTLCRGLVVLTLCAPKVSAAGAKAMPGTAAPLPVPVRAMLWGLPGALLMMVMAPLRAAAVNGVKVMLIGQVPPAMTGGVEIGQLVVKP